MFWSELAQGHTYLAVLGRGTSWSGTPDWPCQRRRRGGADRRRRRRHQGAGIGRRLLTALISEARGRPILLEVRTDNEPAIALYDSMGFRSLGVRRRYYQPSGADAYTMGRP